MFDSADNLESRGHPENLDFLRFALAVLVIYSHSYALLSGGDESDPLFQWSGTQISWGGLAVDAFFILSGYLITFSWLRSRGIVDFLRKRVLRIYPAFIVAVTFGILAVVPLSSDRALSIDVWEWLTSTLRLKGYTPAGAFAGNPVHDEMNGSLWSISYEFWCYVGVALLGVCALLGKRRIVLGMLIASVLGSIVFLVLKLNPGGGFLGVVFGYPPFWARLLPYYLAGCVCYLYRDRVPLSWPLAAIMSALLIAGVWFTPWGVALTFPFALTYLLLFSAYLPIAAIRSWAKYGDFSYGLYLYAFPIQQLLVRYKPDLRPMELFPLAFLLTLIMAVASWYGIERPFMKLKTKPNKTRAGALQDAELAKAPLETQRPT
jgi:peptidoglycan/LPS O-acetylase OafA/YrhL